jgi:carbamoyl-phosphate synthase large subunit
MKILSLGGSQWQIGLLEMIRQLGHELFVVDINPECPGHVMADHFFQADTSNGEVVLDIARREAVDLVIAEQTDRFVPVAAYVNEVLGLPGIGTDVARRFTDKLAMRRQLEGVVDMPAYAEVQTLEDALRFAVLHGYPLVVKPKSAQSSYGVFKVDDESQLRARFSDSLSFSKDGRLLLEVFIDGPEITVEAISIEGCCHVLAVSEKEHYDFNPCVARRLSYPPRYTAERMERIRATAAQVVQTLGLLNGISHAEYRMRGDTPFLVEVAARGGGTKIASLIVPHVAQFNAYALLLRYLCGDKSVMVPMPSGKAAVLLFLDFSAGLVKRIDGPARIEEEGLACELVLNFAVGDVIRRPEDDTQRLGYAIVLGENRDDVDARCRRIQELLVVEYA